ncbi:hypothetical protein MJG53_013953 [Ovis ammon polii x Ovis aries]|uniref:Uncharacterized protein n=1 Tax=Ovis ammon polii x Ovis aries TaxID=2918886 RepID=A0ACB9UJZ3_9CETA|nr:hypothetical protein MJG53_013953 [Ovis ammon polii x Ovis aries]
MDVRFYPAAAGDPAGLDFAQCLGYYGYSKMDIKPLILSYCKVLFLRVTHILLHFIKFGNNNNYMNMAEANNAFFAASEQTFHTPSLGDEEFEIPPITPPPESDPALGMPDVLLPFQGLSDPLPSQGSEFTPQFPPQSLDLPSITISRNLVEQDGVLHSSGLHMDQSHTQVSQYRQDPSVIMRSIVHMTDAARSGIMPPAQLTTINQSQLSAQLGLNLGGASVPHTSPSPPASKSATPSPSSSINEEDADESNRAIGEKRAAPDSGKKPKTPKKKKKKDPNEPQKPVSAYALFFRDTQAAIKGQNPNATFGEVSKIVASMWDSLGEEQKQVYKRKTEAAKKEYLKALAAYRASLVSKAAAESAEAQTIRSVQQTLASTNLTSSLLLNPPLSQHGTVSASPQTLQPSLPRSIAPKPLTMRLPVNPMVTSVTIAANMPSNLGAPLISSMVGSASSAQDGFLFLRHNINSKILARRAELSGTENLQDVSIAKSFPEPEIDDRTRHGASENHNLLVPRGALVVTMMDRGLRGPASCFSEAPESSTGFALALTASTHVLKMF